MREELRRSGLSEKNMLVQCHHQHVIHIDLLAGVRKHMDKIVEVVGLVVAELVFQVERLEVSVARLLGRVAGAQGQRVVACGHLGFDGSSTRNGCRRPAAAAAK